MPRSTKSSLVLAAFLYLFHATQAKPAPIGAQKLKEAARQYEDRNFTSCAGVLSKIPPGSIKNPDAALFLRAQCYFYSGKFLLAKTDFARLQTRYPTSPHAALAAWREADCAWELDAKKSAVRMYEKAQSSYGTARADAAVGLARRALWSYDHGLAKKANALWFELRKRFPLHPLASDAPIGKAKPHLSFDQSLQLAKAFRKSGSPERALEILEAVEPKSSRQKYAFLRSIGLALFDTRQHYEQAARILLYVKDKAKSPRLRQEAWFYASRALGRADHDQQAIDSHLAMVKKYPRSKYSARALFYAAWLDLNQGHCKHAQAVLHRVSREYPSSRWAPKALWFSAWCDIEAKRWDKAIKTLEALSSAPDYEQGARAAYWRAVALNNSGHHEDAIKGFLDLISRYPLTWYSQLSRLRLAGQAPKLPPPVAPTKMKPIADPLLAKSNELISAGLVGFARQLLESEERRFLSAHPKDPGLRAIMEMYTKADDANRPWHLVLTRRRRSLRRLPDSHAMAFWHYAYPAYKRELILEYTGGDVQLSLFIQSIMRTESGFDQMALSKADARGLLQMLPSTASEVALKLHLPDFAPSDLFDPRINVQTGTWYISHLADRFHRSWPLTAAAYNGGIEPMSKWLCNTAALTIDRFVEQIPYTESRQYAKRVFTAMLRYAWLEKQPMPKLDIHLGSACLEGK